MILPITFVLSLSKGEHLSWEATLPFGYLLLVFVGESRPQFLFLFLT
jgi:hypothetical protein